MPEITFKIYTLGCKVNCYDSGVLKYELIAAGLKAAPHTADLVFINTCSVTASAIHKNKRMINKARQENPQAKIVLLGCWPTIDNAQAKKIRADIIWGIGKYKELILQINKLFPNNKQKNIKLSEIIAVDRARYFIKIQDGCEQFCSYCIIPFARGGYQSRSTEEVIREIKTAIKSGYEEFVLSGVHLGMYGREKDSIANTDLVGVLKKILKIKNLGRIRLSSIEVTEVTDELISLMKETDRICRHLHIPLQSGTDKILKLMNRPYDTKDFKNKIDKLRNIMPDIALSTDVIVGFPGETKKDFSETLRFIQACNFNRLHVFSFSAHKKTKAFRMPEPVEKAEIESRSRELRHISKKMEDEHIKRYKNKKLAVIIERQAVNGFIGKTEYYFDIDFTHKDVIDWHGHRPGENLIKKIVDVKYNF